MAWPTKGSKKAPPSKGKGKFPFKKKSYPSKGKAPFTPGQISSAKKAPAGKLPPWLNKYDNQGGQ